MAGLTTASGATAPLGNPADMEPERFPLDWNAQWSWTQAADPGSW